MNTNTQTQTQLSTEAASTLFVPNRECAGGFLHPAPVPEPENKGALPEDRQLMPENKPENRTKIQAYSEGHCVYDEGFPGPFGWKPRSPLDRLPPDDQGLILDLLEQYTYAEVRTFIARPRPRGLGFTFSIGALHAFYYRWRADDLDEKHEMLDQQVEHILAQAGDNDEKFIAAAKHLLKRRLLETSISPTSRTEELRAIFGILDRIKNTELAERRIQLAEQKSSVGDTTQENERPTPA